MTHPSRLERPPLPEPPRQDYTCECGNRVEVELDASYWCDRQKAWHCVDCHNVHAADEPTD